MKQHKLTPYALLLITAGMSVTSYALAEEQLETINVSTELDSSTKNSHWDSFAIFWNLIKIFLK